jgi:hypothetical protein
VSRVNGACIPEIPPVEVGWSSFTVALGGAGVVPVSGWASWLVKEIVAPGLSSKQTRLRELVAGEERCTAPVFVREGTG